MGYGLHPTHQGSTGALSSAQVTCLASASTRPTHPHDDALQGAYPSNQRIYFGPPHCFLGNALLEHDRHRLRDRLREDLLQKRSCVRLRGRKCVPKLKGSIGEGSNHSNFSHQSSARIRSKLRIFCFKKIILDFLNFQQNVLNFERIIQFLAEL